MASSSSSKSSCVSGEYDVFLSFRGEDTRKTFVAHLYGALDRLGFRTFKDDEKLQRGKSISTELLYYINHSRIAVIVFSRNYANSSWCLDELVEIMECMKNKGQIVLPIFYDVKPSQIRKQKRSFFEAFGHILYSQEMKKVERRRAALKEAANISGLDLEDAANGDEEKFLKQTVEMISEKLQPKPFRVAEYEVGIPERMDKVIKLLEEDETLFLGICGIGGAGKTTLAKAVFNRVYKQFERSCFLENVREESTKYGGLANLQSHLLRDILMDQTIKVVYPDRGINEIKDRLGNKRLLLVLDDVNNENILEYLVGVGHEWFASGSKIIITTRDQRLLEKHSVKTYNIPLLDGVEALQLFTWHAFKHKPPEDDYVELSHRAKDYAKGLPLALKVLGSTLGRRSKQEWLALFVRWKNNPPKEIDDVLRISYDDLDKEEQDLFLDVACFFNNFRKEDVMNVYKRDEVDPVIGIKILCERCLISIVGNMIFMHDLLQELGQKIVHQENEDPGKRSRLWSYSDIYEVFNNNTVTEKVQAIMLPKKGLFLEGDDLLEEGLRVSAEAFTKMRKLRILQINGVQLDGCLTRLSNELRYLEWDGYPREYLPHSFQPKNFVQLRLPNSLIKGIETNSKLVKVLKVLHLENCKNLVKNPIFTGFPCLEELSLRGCASLVEVHFEDMKLKSVDLRNCKNLKQTPDLSELPCLETLDLQGCTSVVEVHPSIEDHKRLVNLDLTDCNNLKSLATRINLISLTTLDLNGCLKLEKFSNLQGDMECLKTLSLYGTAIKELPPSVVIHLKGLEILILMGCNMLERLPHNVGEMKSLEELKLSGTAIKDLPPSVSLLKRLRFLGLGDCKMVGSLPSNIGEMKSLSTLFLAGSGIKRLPSSIVQLTQLKEITWGNCNLDEEAFQNLPHSLVHLDLRGNNFASLPESFTHLTNLTNLTLDGCSSLQTLESLPSCVTFVSAQGCVSLERYSILTATEGNNSIPFLHCDFSGSHKLTEDHGNNKPNIYYSKSQLPEISRILVPGSEIPSWFSHIYESGQIDEDITNWVCLRMEDPNSFRYLKEICVCAVFRIEDLRYPGNIELKIHGSYEHEGWFSHQLQGLDHENLKTDHIMFMRHTHVPTPGVYRMCNSDGYYIKVSIKGSYIDPRLLSEGSYEYQRPLKVKVKRWGIHPVMDDHKQR